MQRTLTTLRVVICVALLSAALPSQQSPNSGQSVNTSKSGSPQGAVPIKTVKPVYPIAALKDKRQGEVIIKVTVNESGDVVHAEVVSGDPIFQHSALEAAKQWKYQPYIKDGKPMAFATRIPFDYAFSDRISDASLPLPPVEPDASRTEIDETTAGNMLLHKVTPTYPSEAKLRRIQGNVLFRAVIGTDGRVKALTVISGQKELVQSSADAVQQWRYKPYIRDGQPAEFETKIQVNYTLIGG